MRASYTDYGASDPRACSLFSLAGSCTECFDGCLDVDDDPSPQAGTRHDPVAKHCGSAFGSSLADQRTYLAGADVNPAEDNTHPRKITSTSELASWFCAAVLNKQSSKGEGMIEYSLVNDLLPPDGP